MTFQKHFLCTVAIAAAAFFAPSLHAQITATAPAVSGINDTERLDILGGAAYSHFNPGFAHQVRATNLLGWQGSATGWFGNLFGLEATARGLYGSYDLPINPYNLPATSNASEYLFLFGPSFRLWQTPKYTAGAHLLIGGAQGNFDQAFQGSGIQPRQIGIHNNQLATAFALGGWADYKIAPRFAVRFTADYQPTHYSGIGQNEFFGAVGIVYKIGRRK